jgi:hypothetical protein
LGRAAAMIAPVADQLVAAGSFGTTLRPDASRAAVRWHQPLSTRRFASASSSQARSVGRSVAASRRRRPGEGRRGRRR